MSIRNVVKVMNFHSLIRVDKAKRQADKYLMMEDQLYAMMEAIVNNRNLILDKKIFRVNEDAPKINIYIGSDFGFCSNYNSQVNDQLHKDPAGDVKILIGKKLRSAGLENVWDQIPYSRLEEESGRIQKFLEKQIRTKKCSGINLIYNHYENTTNIYFRKLQIFPISRDKSGKKTHTEDFAIEGDINRIMIRLMETYVYYELMLAVVNSRAAENILRQNATTESLKKIDEIEEEKVMEERREKRNVEFQKVVDTFIKNKMY